MRSHSLLLAALCCLPVLASAAEAPASAAGCAKCHGGSGGKTPALACRPAAELLPLLRRYRETGGRHRALGGLSDTALEEIAAWYAGPGCNPP